MRYILSSILAVLFCFSAQSQVRGVVIIVCGDRADNDIAQNVAKQDLTKMMDTDTLYCYPGAAVVNLPDECNSGTVVLSIELDPADFFEGDALTLNGLTNVNFDDGSETLIDDVDFDNTDFRPAFIADEDSRVEIEFTRDPLEESIFEFRNIDNPNGLIVRVPACTGTVFNGDASPIPTMGQWGLMVLGLILLIFGVNSVVRTRSVQAS